MLLRAPKGKEALPSNREARAEALGLADEPLFDAHADTASIARAPFALPTGPRGAAFTSAALKEHEEERKADKMPIPFAPKDFTHPAHPGIKMSHGTTTLAFVCGDSVYVAVDSRASMGSYIGSGTVKKVIIISDYLLGTMAGGAADCSVWERYIGYRARLHELREGRRITTRAASKILGNIMYSYRGYGLSMGTMMAGYDEGEGPNLFYMDDDGTRLKGNAFSVGSGATYAYGVLDSGLRDDLTPEEAIELGKRAIWHATHRDAYSGGNIRVFSVTREGWKRHFVANMNTFYYDQGYKAELEGPPPAAAAADEAKMDE